MAAGGGAGSRTRRATSSNVLTAGDLRSVPVETPAAHECGKKLEQSSAIATLSGLEKFTRRGASPKATKKRRKAPLYLDRLAHRLRSCCARWRSSSHSRTGSAGAAAVCDQRCKSVHASGAEPSPLASGIERPCGALEKTINMKAPSADGESHCPATHAKIEKFMEKTQKGFP